jgi:hypothetical protein
LYESFKRVPGDIWDRVIDLYFHWARQKSEVLVYFLWNDGWKVVVPKQKVSYGSVNHPSLDLCVDIVTGETYKDILNKTDWLLAGSSHLHPFGLDEFSDTDDEDEFKIAGLHILVSSPNLLRKTCKVLPSITWKNKRYYLEYKEVIGECSGNYTFHPNCLSMIERMTFKYKHKSKKVNSSNNKLNTYEAMFWDYPELWDYKSSESNTKYMSLSKDIKEEVDLECFYSEVQYLMSKGYGLDDIKRLLEDLS